MSHPHPKPITEAGIPAALEKAERYRLLNDAPAAESICLDILTIEPENQQAVITLLLAITDDFTHETHDGVHRAQALIPQIHSPYERAYYSGIIHERLANAQLHRSVPGAAAIASDGYRQAMTYYEKAEAIRPVGNDDPILRWNTCARMLAKHERVAAGREEFEPALGE